MLNRQVQCPNSQEECRVDYYSDQINKLIEEFSRLPGIGKVSWKAGFSFDTHAEGAGEGAGRFYDRGEGEGVLLPVLSYPD